MLKPKPSAPRARPPARTTLNIRVQPGEREVIDRAAAMLGKTRTDFILEASRRAAEEALLDRALMTVDAATFAEFVRRLDAPPAPNARLRRTMRTPAPWDKA